MALPLMAIGSAVVAIWEIFKAFINNPLVKAVFVKGLIIFAMMILLPLALTKFAISIMNFLVQKFQGEMASASMPSQISITGLGAYLVSRCKIIESVNIVMAALVTSFILRCIPFRK